jgi:GDP-L-fucose synthase
MKVLVTGGSGMVGEALRSVVTNDIDMNMKFKFLSREECNLINPIEVDQLFNTFAPDIVVHLASKVGGVYDNMSDNYGFLMDNIKINMNIVEHCNKYNIKKLINILSTCIFPDENVSYPLSSDQLHNGLPHHSNIGYAYSKRLLHVASTLLTNTKVVNLIPTNLYGKNDNYNIKAAHVIPALIHKTYNAKKHNRNLIVCGTGNAVRQFLYAEDLGRVILHFVKTDYQDNMITTIVSPPESDEISIKGVVKNIVNILEFPNLVVYDKSYDNGQLKKTTNNNELQKYIPDFEFTPFSIGLQHTIKHFLENYNISVRK